MTSGFAPTSVCRCRTSICGDIRRLSGCTGRNADFCLIGHIPGLKGADGFEPTRMATQADAERRQPPRPDCRRSRRASPAGRLVKRPNFLNDMWPVRVDLLPSPQLRDQQLRTRHFARRPAVSTSCPASVHAGTARSQQRSLMLCQCSCCEALLKPPSLPLARFCDSWPCRSPPFCASPRHSGGHRKCDKVLVPCGY